jgi:hypothetical protein
MSWVTILTALWYWQALAQAVCGRFLTREASGSIPGEIHMRYVVENVALQQGIFEIASVFPCHYHSTTALYASEDWSLVQQRLQRCSLTPPEENK